ncbi:YwpF-like family protein [Cytobacillus purgationiresistens]|uniref:YwpF-like protein n=1 Tax=Cytobacillus purgationiresistens TaxID=863449 RepID=A0ABU0AEK8_9BACI|nr:YwpF-like family protein [Cytobacillus purgationiresistens]MDQ0269227.1 hypothetical protein [Cytobacillus purgationiresistens]
MKTFKLVSMHVWDEEELVDVNLEDGLIINKEDEKSKWLLEAVLDKKFLEFFSKLEKMDQEFPLQVVITKKDNDPAHFMTRISSINEFDQHINILLEGSLRSKRNEYAENLLDDLVSQGLSGENLLTEFKNKMKSKQRLSSSKK